MSKLIAGAIAATAIALLAGCSSAAPSPAVTSASPAGDSTPVAAGPVATLAPLTLGHFPGTASGKLAKEICGQWAGLRRQYVQKITVDTAYQMNQWFSGPDWAKVQAASLNLDDPAYSNLETALGTGLTGEDASAGSAAAIDKACEHAD